jgi:hypothetical protein
MKDFNFKFNFGNKKPSIKEYAIVAVVLSTIIATLSQCTGVSENSIWDLLDEINRKYLHIEMLTDFIIKDPEKLDRRINRDVSNAIDDYWNQIGEKPAEVSKPRFIEKPIDPNLQTGESRLLGGEMRLCAPWVPDCIDTNSTDGDNGIVK